MELKTIEKAPLIFTSCAEGDAALGTTELSKKLGANKATVWFLLIGWGKGGTAISSICSKKQPTRYPRGCTVYA
jgi:hypothetical protein